MSYSDPTARLSVTQNQRRRRRSPPGAVTVTTAAHLEQLQTWMVAPGQLLPPHRGAGLSQALERHQQELAGSPPPPSSLLQGCHGDHGPKPPSAVWFRSWEPDGGAVRTRWGGAGGGGWGASYRTGGDVLLPLAHVGAVLQGGAPVLPEVPPTVGVPRLQTQPGEGGKEGGGRGGVSSVNSVRVAKMEDTDTPNR